MSWNVVSERGKSGTKCFGFVGGVSGSSGVFLLLLGLWPGLVVMGEVTAAAAAGAYSGQMVGCDCDCDCEGGGDDNITSGDTGQKFLIPGMANLS